MTKSLFIFLQYLVPHHLLTQLMGVLADSQLPWLKNFMIKRFIKRYPVNVNEALIDHPRLYTSFNQFFIRQLKMGMRPICKGEKEIACPVDGIATQIGAINDNQLLQAKRYHYSLENLLGNDLQLTNAFRNGLFATFYLAPHNYHRVHMPLDGILEQTIYIPGKLFSLNLITTEYIPHLYTQNERLLTIFNTRAGKMAVILVGAMIVGKIQTAWEDQPMREKKMTTQSYQNISLSKGTELGYFKLGSTVILLFEKDKVSLNPSLQKNNLVQLGQWIASLKSSNY